MTRDDVIRMAREAGAGNLHGEWSLFGHVALERFAALVAAAEREACAKVCEEVADIDWYWDGAMPCVKAIRARGQA